jgi:hypothetical protein
MKRRFSEADPVFRADPDREAGIAKANILYYIISKT